jgi:hypothetical protein
MVVGPEKAVHDPQGIGVDDLSRDRVLGARDDRGFHASGSVVLEAQSEPSSIEGTEEEGNGDPAR